MQYGPVQSANGANAWKLSLARIEAIDNPYRSTASFFTDVARLFLLFSFSVVRAKVQEIVLEFMSSRRYFLNDPRARRGVYNCTLLYGLIYLWVRLPDLATLASLKYTRPVRRPAFIVISGLVGALADNCRNSLPTCPDPEAGHGLRGRRSIP